MLKNYALRLCTIAIVLLSVSAQAQNSTSLWTRVDEQKAKQSEQVIRKIKLQDEAFFHLNLEALKTVLETVGNRENTGNTVVSFPNSEGKLSAYQVFEASVMEDELQAKYPNLRSYAGQGVDNPNEIIRFSVTTKGLHAMVLGTQKGTQFIDPFSTTGDLYTVYAKSAIYDSNFEFECGVIEDETLLENTTLNTTSTLDANDATLRNYRLAVACTGEYAQFHGGTVADALAAIVVTITRVNSVYERDLSITLTLVADNEDIIFTDPATDNLNNDNESILISQSQSVIDAAITTAGYDVGHTFSTGAGGLAGVGVTCNSNFKARGVTGVTQPIGDAFDIDYVSHELGHQFGAPHTFNGTVGSCSGGNRSTFNAYEPGSGSTIMAYAGICGSDNVQVGSDAYFHQNSLNAIWSHVSSTGTCPVNRTATGNSEPTAEAGANYSIPKGTPYKLNGSNSTDVDGLETLTYTWEQYDLGNAGVPTETITSGPLVRSFEGTTNPTRFVPQLSDLLNNGGTSTTWEKLSNVDRNINFKLTVRDNDSRGGQTDSDQMTITNVSAAGPFVVTSQSESEIVWTPGETETITWDVAGTTGNGVNTANVNILLSTDEGLTYTTVLASNVPNNGSYTITVPDVSAPKCRVMVEGAGNIFFNVNTSFFAIGNYVYENVQICESYTYNLNTAVPESTSNYTGYGLTFPTSINMTDANITVDITHPNSGDLFYGVRHPEYSGSFLIRLASQECSGTANPNLVFDDQGSAINCGTLSNGDNVIPEDALSAVNGTNAQGNWIFYIFDNTINNTSSVLNSVTIEACQFSTEAVLSVEDNELEALSIYPNPNNGDFNVQFNPRSGEAISLAVYDIRGRAIYAESYNSVSRFNETVHLQNAQSGVYLLTITDGGQKVTKKIIVE
ncbi:MAG: reprolysin-like metallopeptidase [Winogradskyella arenosi]